VTKLIIDQVIKLRAHFTPLQPWVDVFDSRLAALLAAELLLALLADVLGRGTTLVDSLLSDRFSDEASLRIMRHAATLDLRDFEDSGCRAL